jgi:hypothetical protein
MYIIYNRLGKKSWQMLCAMSHSKISLHHIEASYVVKNTYNAGRASIKLAPISRPETARTTRRTTWTTTELTDWTNHLSERITWTGSGQLLTNSNELQTNHLQTNHSNCTIFIKNWLRPATVTEQATTIKLDKQANQLGRRIFEKAEQNIF